MAAELENDRRENVRKLAKAHPWHVSQNGLRCSHENGEALKEVGQVGEKTVFLGDEEGAIRTCKAAEAMAAAILWQSETTFSLFERRPGAKSELASLILAQEVSYKNWDKGTRNSAAANFAEALRQ